MSTTQTHLSVQTFSSTRNSTVTNSSKDLKCYACNMTDDSQSKIGNKNPITLVKKAREIWLEKSDVRTAKKLYLRALQCSKENALAYNVSSESSLNCKGGESKKRKLGSNALVTLSSNQTREVIEKIALLLIQSGKAAKATSSLKSLGYTCRLSSLVLDYPLEGSLLPSSNKADIPCIIIDNFLSNYEERVLSSVFHDPEASYWKDHSYKIEPPTPYFSYIIPVNDTNNYGFVGKLAHDILHCKTLRKKFPKLKKAHFIEMWAHNRPHPSGHQCHFDSDDEGIGGVRNPIVSTIVYVSADSGGPSFVTSQRLEHDHLAERGYLSHPKPRRLVAFDGKVLHGVVPGKGKCPVDEGRRVTVMFAFWKHIDVRWEDNPGAARPFPLTSKHKWVNQLLFKDAETSCIKNADKIRTNMRESLPIEISCVYETLEGDSWTKDMGMPEYDQVFQGF